MNKLDKIKLYFNELNDWNTATEYEYFKYLISEAERLEEIKDVMGFSHADCFDENKAIEQIKTILEYY